MDNNELLKELIKNMEQKKPLEVYTVEQVAEKLSITVRTVYNYIKSGQLKGCKMGKYWRITEDQLRDFLKGLEQN